MFKDRLRTIRLEKGLTMVQMAEKLGISYPAYSQWERGVRNPKDSTLLKIAEALEVTPDYLTGQTYVIDLEPYSPTEEDMKAIKQLIDNYFKAKQ